MLDEKIHTKPFQFFLSVSKKEIKWLSLNILFYSAGAVSVLAASYFLGRAIDDMSISAGQHVRGLLIVVVLCVISYEVAYRLGHLCEVLVLSRLRNHIKKSLFDHTTSLSFGYFADQFAGEIAHKVAATANAYEQMVIVVTNGFIEGAVLILLSIIALGSIHPYFSIFIIAWACLYLFGVTVLARKLYTYAALYAAEEAKTTGALVDTYGNIGSVKVYGKNEHLQKTHAQIDAETKVLQRFGLWDVVLFNYQGVFMIALSIGLILITARLYARYIVTVGEIIFISAAALRLFNVVWEMGKNMAGFIRYRGECIQNLRDLVVAPAIVDGDRHALEKTKQARVEYCHVNFSYNQENLILNDFSFSVLPGEKVGIVGLSGAGKTTFVNLLLRFFDPQGGHILLNGEDIAGLTQESLRSHISYISQDTSLFHASVAENIAYGSPAASFEEIQKIATLAYADEFIQTLPKQYESIVGERGVKLSGGQRQRIAIARALLANRPLFLLDEATSALDSDSEAKIQKGLEALMERKTVIAIAHRLSTISRMDRIIYLEKGKILEDGTHEQLLARGGKYAKLWHMQAGGFLPDLV